MAEGKPDTPDLRHHHFGPVKFAGQLGSHKVPLLPNGAADLLGAVRHPQTLAELGARLAGECGQSAGDSAVSYSLGTYSSKL